MTEPFDDIQWGKVWAEAWIDPTFKARLESDPHTTLREFARREFGLEVDCQFDGLTIPDAPVDMFAEQLSGSGRVSATATGTATAGGNVSATAGRNVSATATGTATAGGR